MVKSLVNSGVNVKITIFYEKMAFFLKTNVMVPILPKKRQYFDQKTANFLTKYF
jgi:hypothetical protein